MLAHMTPEQTTDFLIDLVSKGQWLPLLVVVAGLFGRLLKADVPWFFTVPSRYRAWAVVGFGLLEGVLSKVAAGVSWPAAIVAGLLAGVGAISGHELVVEGIRNGRDIGVPKSGGGGPGAGLPIIPSLGVLCLVLLTACGAHTQDTGCQVVRAADERSTFVVVVFPDGTREQVPRSMIAGLALDRMAARVQLPVQAGDAR